MPTAAIPDTTGLSFQEWADTVQGFTPLLMPMVPQGTQEWREWAKAVCEVFSQVPQPTEAFSTWEDWAHAMKFVLN